MLSLLYYRIDNICMFRRHSEATLFFNVSVFSIVMFDLLNNFLIIPCVYNMVFCVLSSPIWMYITWNVLPMIMGIVNKLSRHLRIVRHYVTQKLLNRWNYSKNLRSLAIYLMQGLQWNSGQVLVRLAHEAYRSSK